jgi:hypothetical protein
MFTLSLEGFRSSTTPSRICSRPPQLSSRLPRGDRRVVGLPPLPSIPFRITSFADHHHLTPIESNSYKNHGGSGCHSLPSAQSPSAYMQETPQPFLFHVATHSFVHTGGWGYPVLCVTSAHVVYTDPVGRAGVLPERLGACVHERNPANPLPSIHYALSPCTTGCGVPLLGATSAQVVYPRYGQGIGVFPARLEAVRRGADTQIATSGSLCLSSNAPCIQFTEERTP